jgi:dipeptidyl aminopeptidase/acylaminoacyl peptidase
VVHLVSPGGGSPRPLAETFDRWGRYSELIGWSADGKRLFYTECRRTQVTLNALPLDGPPQVLSDLAGTIGEGVLLNASAGKLGFTVESTDRPVEAYVADVVAFKPVRVSQVNETSASSAKTEAVSWKGPDGWTIEGLLTYPAGYEKGKKYPFLLIIHGGPMGVFTQSYAANPYPYPAASFAARGYAVLRANPRGSSGYGLKFRHANYGDWGGKDFQDLMAGVDHVIAQGVADPERMGVMGWSYGGFMTSWTITQTQRFKAASVGAGVTNLMSFTGTADIPGFLPDYFKGEYWDKPDAYQKHSAMFRIKGVTTPTLIQHGDKDERVPLSQGEELYNALKRQGCTVQMVVYPRQPHAIQEPRLLADAMRRNLEWFDRYVKGK